ncbi:MAG: hypothetical protein Q8O88_00865 [bacterium]|nr:hypothetical protein [bacterium]
MAKTLEETIIDDHAWFFTLSPKQKEAAPFVVKCEGIKDFTEPHYYFRDFPPTPIGYGICGKCANGYTQQLRQDGHKTEDVPDEE